MHAGITGPIALVGTLAYILSFAVGAGPVPGLLVPEITAARIRGAHRRDSTPLPEVYLLWLHVLGLHVLRCMCWGRMCCGCM